MVKVPGMSEEPRGDHYKKLADIREEGDAAMNRLAKGVVGGVLLGGAVAGGVLHEWQEGHDAEVAAAAAYVADPSNNIEVSAESHQSIYVNRAVEDFHKGLIGLEVPVDHLTVSLHEPAAGIGSLDNWSLDVKLTLEDGTNIEKEFPIDHGSGTTGARSGHRGREVASALDSLKVDVLKQWTHK